MKYVKFVDGPTHKALDVLQLIVREAPNGGINMEDIEKRVRIKHALNASDDGLGAALEDADHALLVKLVKEFRFRVADEELLNILRAVTEAKAPSVIMMKPPANDEAVANGAAAAH